MIQGEESNEQAGAHWFESGITHFPFSLFEA